MSLPIWTPDALASEAGPYAGLCWRVVEAQHAVSTMKLVDSWQEQQLLEELLEDSKPPVPPECERLHYLLFTPFRYDNRHGGSRFRAPGERQGVFYAAQQLRTALCEAAFWRLLFFAESPQTPWPAEPLEHTAFSVQVDTHHALDLTQKPFADHEQAWRHPTDYAACRQLAQAARKGGVELIRYRSVRDPQGGLNVALLTCRAFARDEPAEYQTWKFVLKSTGVIILRAAPWQEQFTLPRTHFAHDPRTQNMRWER